MDREIKLSSMISKIKHKLIELARQDKLITYGELVDFLRLDVKYKRLQGGVLFAWLNWLSRYERKHGRPLLSVLVVREDTKLPGYGFAKLLGKYNVDSLYVLQMQRDCFEFWQDDEKYFRYKNDLPDSKAHEVH